MTTKEVLLSKFEKFDDEHDNYRSSDLFLAGAKAGLEMAVEKANKLTFLFPIDRNKGLMGQALKKNIEAELHQMIKELE